MIPQTIYGGGEHQAFRDTARRFIDREIAPHHAQWEKDGVVSRELWTKAGAAGLLCPAIPEEYGGGGGDFTLSAIVTEELSRGVFNGPGFRVHSDIAAFSILHYGTEAQRRHWLPRMATGEVIVALAMTETRRRQRCPGHPHHGDPRRR